MTGLSEHLNAIVERWKKEMIPIRPGVTSKAIESFEDHYRVTLPDDMREFFQTVDGMGGHYDDDSFSRFWPLEEVQPIDRYRPELANRYAALSDYFLFYDHSIDLFMCAIRLQKNAVVPNPIARLYPHADGSFEPAYQSFSDVIVRYANDPKELW
jgi:SMI1 / KNR4 family (SUKH-1)